MDYEIERESKKATKSMSRADELEQIVKRGVEKWSQNQDHVIKAKRSNIGNPIDLTFHNLPIEYEMNTKFSQGQDSAILKEVDRLLNWNPYNRYLKPPGDHTIKDYERRMKLLLKAHTMPHEYCSERNLSKGTYDSMRAAFTYKIAESLKSLKEQSINEGKLDLDFAKKVVELAKNWQKERGREYVQERNQTRERRQRESGKVSKRKVLRKLPQDWRDRLEERMENSKYRDAVKILHLTGCRPSELQKGVRISAKDGEVSVTILGSKCSDRTRSGQDIRRLTWDEITEEGAALQEICERTGSNEVKIESPQSFQKVYREAAERELGKPGKHVTPYAARHQFSADLKARGFDKITVAAAMGHQSTRSQGQYGLVNQGGGGGGPRCEASQQIRDPNREPSHDQSTGLRM